MIFRKLLQWYLKVYRCIKERWARKRLRKYHVCALGMRNRRRLGESNILTYSVQRIWTPLRNICTCVIILNRVYGEVLALGGIECQLFHVLRLYSQYFGHHRHTQRHSNAFKSIFTDGNRHRESKLTSTCQGAPTHHLPTTGAARPRAAILLQRGQWSHAFLIRISFAMHTECLALTDSWQTPGSTSAGWGLTHQLWYA